MRQLAACSSGNSACCLAYYRYCVGMATLWSTSYLEKFDGTAGLPCLLLQLLGRCSSNSWNCMVNSRSNSSSSNNQMAPHWWSRPAKHQMTGKLAPCTKTLPGAGDCHMLPKTYVPHITHCCKASIIAVSLMLQARLQHTDNSSSGAWLQSVCKDRNSCTLMLRLTR